MFNKNIISTRVKAITVQLSLLLLVLLFLLSDPVFARAGNPFIRHIFTADPSVHVWADGRLYVYPSHDVAPPQGCDLMDGYHVFSTTDMEEWTDHGQILHSSNVDWGLPQGGFMWAPDCAYRAGTYYFYFPHPSDSNWNSSWKIGVATSSNPASGFTDQGYIPGLESLIDPCVFIDDDNQAYLYYGGGGVCKGGMLKTNMMEVDGSMQDMNGLVDFHEAAWVFKRTNNGSNIYYLMYADNHDDGSNHNRMRYATASAPLGPWHYQNIFVPSTGSFTMHGSVVKYQSKWWLFYHDSSLSGGHDWLRSCCFDPVYFNADGTVQTVNLTASSIPIGVNWPVLYTDTNFGGTSAFFTEGAFTTADLTAAGIADNSVSSVKVPEGYLLEIFDGDNQTGSKWNMYAESADLAVSGCNDKLSSLRITTNTNFTKYEAETGTVGNGATIEGDHIGNLHMTDAYFELSGIDGHSGGQHYLDLFYASDEASVITVYVNGAEAGMLSCPETGGWNSYSGNTRIPVILDAGSNNVIRLAGGSGGNNADYIGIIAPVNNNDTLPPVVNITSGPVSSIITNQPFIINLSVSESCGFWRTNYSAWQQFSNTTVIYITADTRLEYYGRDIADNTSLTNIRNYTFDLSAPSIEILYGPANDLVTNAPFDICFHLSEGTGMLSLDNTVYYSFTWVSNIHIHEGTPGIWFYSYDQLGNRSATNHFTFSWITNTNSPPRDNRLKIYPAAIPSRITSALIEGIPVTAKVKIYNLQGEMVAGLEPDREYTAADNKRYGCVLQWNLTDFNKQSLPAGVYILRAGKKFIYFTLTR
ncbi:MAG TPA: family 43 glycosylhydrolase [Spirochaetota bacterium]|nr:family 43 glycosylhydrolase [Spirochaetota bacterium]